jgi:hypothetical protein
VKVAFSGIHFPFQTLSAGYARSDKSLSSGAQCVALSQQRDATEYPDPEETRSGERYRGNCPIYYFLKGMWYQVLYNGIGDGATWRSAGKLPSQKVGLKIS